MNRITSFSLPMQVFYKNYKNCTSISQKNALDCSVWQALEIFDQLPKDDDSFIGFINAENQILKLSKHNKFVWLINVPSPNKKGSYRGYFTRQRCRIIIQELFNSLKFKDIPGLEFEKYL